MATASRVSVAQALHTVFGEGNRIPEGWDASLSGEDASLAHALLGLCLRRWGTLQGHVRPQLKDPGRPIPLGTQVALAIGLCQLAWLPGITDHAAVNEAVELAADRTLGFPPHKGLVNALLRKASRNRELLASELAALPRSLDRTPFTERLLPAALAPWGSESRLEELWARLSVPPRPCFRALDEGPLPPGLVPDPRVEGALRLETGALFPREWLVRGGGMVQDLSSQALLDFAWDGPLERILDLCAAPGGKTTLLSRRHPGALLTAIERHPARARRLQDNLAIRRVKASVVVGDAIPWLERNPQPQDLILLDAPCSGSGTLQKHPELNWLGDALDLERLVRAQRQLLEAAVPRLAPGGLLVYAVCSWIPAEAHDQRAWLKERFPRLLPAPLWREGLSPLPGPSDVFQPDPLTWDGEGFQAFACQAPLQPD